MNHRQNYIEATKAVCQTVWFKDHVAGMIGEPVSTARVIAWNNPKSWNYGCRFIIHRRWLCVVGDIGEATFEWSEDLTLEFLAVIDFGYFLSKCRASPEGRKFEQWDSKVAWLQASDYIKELKQSDERRSAKEIGSLCRLGADSCKDDYDEAAHAIYYDTGESELASMVSDWGNVPSCHAIGMFVGLQMAIAQLKQ